MASDSPSRAATPHAKSNALCNLGMFLVVLGVVASVFELPFVRDDLSPDKIFAGGIISGSLCFVTSAYIKAKDLTEFFKGVGPFRRAGPQ